LRFIFNVLQVHFFATATRESYDEHHDLHPEALFDKDMRQGLLANYLLDPEHYFHDEVTKALLVLATGSNDFADVAMKRFR